MGCRLRGLRIASRSSSGSTVHDEHSGQQEFSRMIRARSAGGVIRPLMIVVFSELENGRIHRSSASGGVTSSVASAGGS